MTKTNTFANFQTVIHFKIFWNQLHLCICQVLSLLQYWYTALNNIWTLGEKTPLELTQGEVSILIYYSTAATTTKKTEENLRKKINTQEKDGESCYILFPTLPLYKHSKLVQVTRAHSHPTMAFTCQIGVLRDKGCNKTKILFDQIMYFWKCPAIDDSISHHPPFPFKSNSDSSHKHSEHLMIYRSKQTLACFARLQYTEEQEQSRLCPRPEVWPASKGSFLLCANPVYFGRGEDNDFISQFLL